MFASKTASIAAWAMLCASAGSLAATDSEAKRPSYWRERTSFFRTFGQPADVVMLGDSLTDGAEWREMFPAQVIVNRGIDSDTSDGVLARLDDLLKTPPRQVFLMIGINDFADAKRSVDAVFANIRATVARLEGAGVQVIVQSTLPCNEAKAAWKSCAALNVKVRQLDVRLATLASKNVRFVDLVPLMAAGGGLRSEFTYDGVHLNGAGYSVWKDAIAPLMPPLAQPTR